MNETNKIFKVMKKYPKKFTPVLITCVILFASCFCNAQTNPQTEEISFVAPQTDTNTEEEINYLKAEIELLTIEIKALEEMLEDLNGNLDGMSEMSQMTSLRLQMTMDRRSKFISMLAQMMKKISTTQDILVQNIK